jgi:predicted short-subunit dehydrogenase-like oxidoreductase (DUF2520 family)
LSRRVAVVGSGRAGGAFARALTEAGWSTEAVRARDLISLAGGPGPGSAAPEALGSAEMVLLCVPDSAVAQVARGLAPSEGRVVAHCSGSLGLDVLDPAPRRASVHPLASLPDAAVGAARLVGAWFAVSGDPVASEVVGALRGHVVALDDADRATYHAAAAIASNHLVALMGQVERVANSAGVPLEAYRRLALESLEGAFDTAPAEALTGPVARGDWDTVRRHLVAIPVEERPAYLAMAAEAARLAGREVPELSE